MNCNPYILEERKLNVTPIDIFSRLLQDRIIFLNSEIDDEVATNIQAQLLYLESLSQEPISFYINSPGGYVSSGLGIYDTINLIKSPVNTICIGTAASMAAILLSAGANRSILSHSKVMIHQPSGGTLGTCSDIQIAAKEIADCKETLSKILAEKTKQPLSKILVDIDRDYWLSSTEALSYGLVDTIL